MNSNMEYKESIRKALLLRTGKPVSLAELFKLAGARKEQHQQYKMTLDDMINLGEIVFHRRGYISAADLGLLPATITKVKGTFGFARLKPADGEQQSTGQEIFIRGKDLMGAMPGDRVLLKVHSSGRELNEGKVFSILERANSIFSGEVSRQGREYYLVPDGGSRIPLSISYGMLHGAKPGDKVTARIRRFGTNHYQHEVEVDRIFGRASSAKACCEALCAASGAPIAFSAEALSEAEALAHPLSEQDCVGRLDLRNELIFTIDSADSKDMDDAISLKRTQEGWELGVFIADVSHYVRPGSVLDEEAFERGTSIYYADKVIPMLPKALSNGICSLNPGEDRLAFGALLTLSPDGTLVDYRFEKSVIRSHVKGVYHEVNAILSGEADEKIKDKYQVLLPMIAQMDELATKLIRLREARGALDLDSLESKIQVDDEGRAVDLMPRTRGKSERIIEEFMLLANEAAARLAQSLQLPFVYRVHERPSPERLQSLGELLSVLGIPAPALEAGCAPAVLSKVLANARETRYASLVNDSVVRSMAKARYAPSNLGHYGLALTDYCHFTSPIRRYPDLAIHRVLSGLVAGETADELRRQYRGFCSSASDQSSDTELRAMSLERNCEDRYRAEYLSQFIGEEFDGEIVSAAPQGLYVCLPNTAEGLVSPERIPGGYFLFDGRLGFYCEQTGRSYKIGDSVRIRVDSADVSSGQVDFSLVVPGEEYVPVYTRASSLRGNESGGERSHIHREKRQASFARGAYAGSRRKKKLTAHSKQRPAQRKNQEEKISDKKPAGFM